MKHFLPIILLLLLSAGFTTQSRNVHAEVISGEAIPFDVTRDGLQNKMEQLEAKQGIDPDSKDREMKWYQLSDKNIGDQHWFEFFAQSYQQILEKAPDQLKDDTDINANLIEITLFDNNQQYTDKELELLIVNSRGELRTVSEKISKLESELNKYINRPQKIREETLVAKQNLKQAKLESNIARQGTENKYEYMAHQVYFDTLMGALSAEFKKLELEELINPLQIQLNKLRLSVLIEQRNRLQDIIDRQEALLETLQLAQAESLEEELIQTAKESAEKHRVIQQIIQNNIQWSRDLQSVVKDSKQYEHQIDKIEAYKRVVEEDFKNAEKKIKLAGLNPVLGRVLREQRNHLADNKLLFQNQIDISDATGKISLALYKIELRQKQLLNMQDELDQQVLQVLNGEQKEKISPDAIKQIRKEVQLLLDKQKNVLTELGSAYLKNLRVLGDYQFSQQQLLHQMNEYASYLDERLLWVPSSLPINFNYPLEVYHSIRWLGTPDRWLQVAQDLLGMIKSKLVVSSFSVLILVLLLYINPFIQKATWAIKEKIGKPYSDKIYYTFEILLFNIILILPVPLVIFYVSWLLSLLPFQSDFSRAVGVGLHHAAVVGFILQFFIRFFEDQGIAELHFRWHKKTVCLIRRQISWMQLFIIPSIFVMYMTSAIHTVEYSDSLGRLALFVFMLVLLIFAIRVFKPGNGILNDYFINNTHLWWARLRYFWLLVFMSIPVIIVGFSIMGYFISALELQQKTIITIRMIFIAIIAHSLIIRWLGLTKRKLALKNSRIRTKAEEFNAQPSELSSTESQAKVNEELLDIPKLNEQTEKIVNVLISTLLLISFWLVWKNMLPAFSFIDNIVLWQHSVIVNGQTTIQAVTLTNVFLAGLYVFLIGIAALNFPGVMEMFIFRNLDIEAGSRYAINQLAKYTLIAIGFISVANELGGSWGQVQWLVAALTVGLGFGLQEIFANMVSGIILLFERPIRVGDTVTVDNITGRVIRIQMRATTIMDWNQKELIVPNKTFITNQLVNWTLTDPVTRIVIPIGISYGSDIDLAYKTILETVCATHCVLKDPKPSVYFIGFGDSSLDFTIRVYVNELAHRMPVTHDIHMRLIEALRKQGIEIPFPQRDINIRTPITGLVTNTP